LCTKIELISYIGIENNLNVRYNEYAGECLIMKMRNIGEVISALRKQKGITQEELGNTTALSRVIIAKIENNQRAVSLDEAVRIARVFEINIDTLYGFIENEKEETEEETFVMAFKAKGMDARNLKDVRRIELLVDALFAQKEIRGE